VLSQARPEPLLRKNESLRCRHRPSRLVRRSPSTRRTWGVNFSTTVNVVGGACAVFYFCRRPAREILSRAPSVRDIQDAIQRSASLASLPGYQATMEASRRIAAVGNRLVRTVSQMTLAGRQQRQRGRDREANAGDDPPPGPERYPMLESPDREVKFVP
jgi:hypothetical protein